MGASNLQTTLKIGFVLQNLQSKLISRTNNLYYLIASAAHLHVQSLSDLFFIIPPYSGLLSSYFKIKVQTALQSYFKT